MMWFLTRIFIPTITFFVGYVGSDFLDEYFPAPSRITLAIDNFFQPKPLPLEDKFLVVLCWFEDDSEGEAMEIVEDSFRKVRGFEMERSARIVNASGTADKWRKTIEDKSKVVLNDWNADLVVVGDVNQKKEEFSLWIVRRQGDDTLAIGYEQYYELRDVKFDEKFHDELNTELTALAWAALSPFTNTKARGQVLDEGLKDVINKLKTLLRADTFNQPKQRAKLQLLLGTALQTSGERESGKIGSVRLGEAVKAYQEALKVYTREEVPKQWALTTNNLGNVLKTWGERDIGKIGTARLEEAVKAYHNALEIFNREDVPHDWAMIQNNLGTALKSLGARETRGTERLQEAVALHREALEIRTRKSEPFLWALTKNNLGNALKTLGEREEDEVIGTAHLEKAVKAYHEALEIFTREDVPHDWAMIQNNLGGALKTLGVKEKSAEHLDEAVTVYREALEIRTRESMPFLWAMTKNNLGAALMTLGDHEDEMKFLTEAMTVYREALEIFDRENESYFWANTKYNLGIALMNLGKHEDETKFLNEAMTVYREALEVFTHEGVLLQQANTLFNIGYVLLALGESEGETKHLEEAMITYEQARIAYMRADKPILSYGALSNLNNVRQRMYQMNSELISYP